MSCLIVTPEIRELAKKFPNETEQSVLNLVSLWQEKNSKSIEDIPLGSELNDFIKEIRKAVPSKWARTAENGYEVSTRGDKRFSALVATFNKGTVIDGVDVGGRTIEDVYQSVIKKSKKGQPPSKDSVLNIDALDDEGHPIFDASKLPKDLLEIVVNYATLGGRTLTKEELEDFSYYEGYLPLWQEWARQNPKLMNELRAKSVGKTLTDQFANTRVSQARALAEILNSQSVDNLSVEEEAPSNSFDTPKVTLVETQQKVDLLFDPKTRLDRVSLIARLFSNEVDSVLQEMTDSLKRRIDDASGVEKEELQIYFKSI